MSVSNQQYIRVGLCNIARANEYLNIYLLLIWVKYVVCVECIQTVLISPTHPHTVQHPPITNIHIQRIHRTWWCPKLSSITRSMCLVHVIRSPIERCLAAFQQPGDMYERDIRAWKLQVSASHTPFVTSVQIMFVCARAYVFKQMCDTLLLYTIGSFCFHFVYMLASIKSYPMQLLTISTIFEPLNYANKTRCVSSKLMINWNNNNILQCLLLSIFLTLLNVYEYESVADHPQEPPAVYIFYLKLNKGN